MNDKVISINNLSITFGALKVIEDMNFNLNNNELLGLIGPNGAGKTTFFNILTGIYPPSSGEYMFNGEEIKKISPFKLVQKGIARTFQNIRLFKHLTVLDNVIVASNFKMKYGILEGMFRLPRYWKEEEKVRKEGMNLLKIFDLDKYASQSAGNLSYGNQRKLEIVRAMATGPKVLLLDEPAAGMNPTETEELMNTIKEVKEKFNVAIILIEHDMKFVLGICERVVVLDHGIIISEGNPKDVIKDPKVIAAYLGEEEI